MKYGVIPFRFGRAAAQPVELKVGQLYETVALGSESDISTSAELLITVPLTYEMMSDGVLFHRIASEYATSWIDSVDVVIVDLANPDDQILPNHHVVGGLAQLVRRYSKTSEDRPRRFILLLPTMLPMSDATLQPLIEYIDSGNVALLSRNGDRLVAPRFGTLVSQDDFVRAVRDVRGSSLDIVRSKLIRFPGHFRRHIDTPHSHCTNYFFDGRLCQEELVDLIDAFVSDEHRRLPAFQLFYHSTMSSWFESVVNAFAKRSGITIPNLEEGSEAISFLQTDDVLIIVPLIDTGTTVERITKAILQHRSTARVKILSMLATNRYRGEGQSFSLNIESHETVVHFLLRVAQSRFERDQCPLCASGVPVSDPRAPDPYEKLSTHTFWTLAMNFGFVTEQNVPEAYRDSVGYVPNFKNVDVLDGPFLAYKINAVLHSGGRELPANPIVICPQEDGASAIASWLEIVYGMTVIRIPKDGLHESLRGQGAAAAGHSSPLASESQWQVQMNSLRRLKSQANPQSILGVPNYSVIIFDDLNVTGKTQGNFIAFAERFGLEVLCCLSIINMSKAAPAHSKPVLSLYDIRVH